MQCRMSPIFLKLERERGEVSIKLHHVRRSNKKKYFLFLYNSQVQPQDIIGIYFPEKNPIPFDKKTHDCDRDRAAFYLRYPSSVRVGKTFDFTMITSSKWFPCREYSMQAVIETGSKKLYTLQAHVPI